MKQGKKEFLTTKEVSDLLHINEKKVYALVQAGKIPGTKITGKWLFPRDELQDHFRKNARKTVEGISSEFARARQVILLSGSDDPVISMLQGIFHSQHPDISLYSSSVGSGEGLQLLKDGFCHIALSHLYHPEEDDYNFPFIRELFDNPDNLVVVNLFYRNIGFISRDPEVTSFHDIIKGNLRFINRQAKSGIRNQVDRIIAEEGLDTKEITGYEHEAYTHFDVAHHILSGRADAGIATETIAHNTSLSFHKLFQERFDMVIYTYTFFNRPIQILVEFIRSDVFLGILKNMKGYDSRETGRVLYPK
ncbi:MAG TPA: helix-turn-helix transcriptional regulator [Deltaproteobacteria bacterium]|nr:helix-turn-helix transcriptional regulator [Deltaproteobacteria bacterium]